jgi:hypothetical protein
MVPTPWVAALYPRTQRVNATGTVQPWRETMNHRPSTAVFGLKVGLTNHVMVLLGAGWDMIAWPMWMISVACWPKQWMPRISSVSRWKSSVSMPTVWPMVLISGEV